MMNCFVIQNMSFYKTLLLVSMRKEGIYIDLDKAVVITYNFEYLSL